MRSFVITCGVNAPPGGSRLRFAEKDARDLFRLFTGGLAAPVIGEVCLVGRQATVKAVADVFRYAAEIQPEHLIFANSGHANAYGLSMADRLLPFEDLGRLIEHVGARTSITCLDCCYAGAFFEQGHIAGIDDGEAWIDVLANATDGNRVIAATDGRSTTREDGARKNGRLTRAILDAAQRTPGDLRDGEFSFVSDRALFGTTAVLLRARYGPDARPVARKLTGDLPLVRSASDAPVGHAEIVALRPRTSGLAADVEIRVHGRRRLTTKVTCELVAAGLFPQRLAGSETCVVPSSGSDSFVGPFEFRSDAILESTAAWDAWYSGRMLRVVWRVRVMDGYDRVLAAAEVPFRYRPPRSVPRRAARVRASRRRPGLDTGAYWDSSLFSPSHKPSRSVCADRQEEVSIIWCFPLFFF